MGIYSIYTNIKSASHIEDDAPNISITDFASLLADVSSSLLSAQKSLLGLGKKNKLNYREISLLDNDFFDLISSSIGMSRTTLYGIDTHIASNIPVFTASQNPVAYIEELTRKPPILADKEHVLLSFATNGDGSTGRNFVFHDRPFYINMDRIAIKIVDERVDVRYLYSVLHDMKVTYGFNHAHKANRHNLVAVRVAIPTDENGRFCLTFQQELADTFMIVEQTKAEICSLRQLLSDVNVVIESDEFSMEYFALPMLFETSKGFAKYTKKYGNIHSGQYPVYSASSQTPLTHLDTYDYDGRYITWATNGFAGTILILDGRFSINGDRGILLPKDDRTDLDFDYMKFILEPIFREMAKGRRGDNGEDEFTKLYPSMLEDVMIPVPVDQDKHISLEAQKSIAKNILRFSNARKKPLKNLIH